MSPSPSPAPTLSDAPSSSPDSSGPSQSHPFTMTTAPRFLPPADPDDLAMSPESRSPEAAAAGSAPVWLGPEPDDEPRAAAPTSSRKSGESRASSPVDPDTLREAAEAVVLTATTLLHENLTAADPIAADLGMWLADEQDVAGIAGPAAGIIGRRSGDLGGGNPDLADVFALAIAVAGYAVKQLSKLRLARMARRAGAVLNTGEQAGE